MPADRNAALVDDASRGDTAAIEELLEQHLPRLLAYVRLHAGPLLKEKESIADLANSVCREVLEDMAGFEYRGEAPFRKWLFSKAMSKIVDRQRYYLAQRRNPAREQKLAEDARLSELNALHPSFCSPSQVAIRKEDLDQLEKFFQRLPEDYRKVITYARILGYCHAEIAAEMGKSEGTVRVLLHRALARLGWLVHEAKGENHAE
jgi:RNA polymerase sigma-70 factor (ECF subfamily)